MNGLASVVRGTGNMLLPAIVICVGVVLLIPISPVLIFGFGPIPGFGIAGGGLALIAYYLGGTLVLGAYILSGRNPARFRWVRLDWRVIGSVMRVGALSSLQSIQTNVVVGGATALVALQGGVDAVAGFGTGVLIWSTCSSRSSSASVRRWWRWWAPISVPGPATARCISR
ncbi:hypothetical protein V5F63_11380 [Xanthobacter autotrophicus DSM 597]|uniref:hypothetical protein n=1 Tax=Xanthobacter wiegelii TaxID=3119913 RepID=UPI0037268A97